MVEDNFSLDGLACTEPQKIVSSHLSARGRTWAARGVPDLFFLIVIYQAQKRDLLPRAARRGFTLAITNNDADDVHMLLRAWKTWTVRLLADSNALDTWSRSQVMFAFMVVDS